MVPGRARPIKTEMAICLGIKILLLSSEDIPEVFVVTEADHVAVEVRDGKRLLAGVGVGLDALRPDEEQVELTKVIGPGEAGSQAIPLSVSDRNAEGNGADLKVGADGPGFGRQREAIGKVVHTITTVRARAEK